MPNNKSELDKSLIGVAGVHFIVSELSLRGLIALPTIRNTMGVDIVVTKRDGSWHANLQVKSSQRRSGKNWPVGSRYSKLSGKDNYFVFVRYRGEQALPKFEVLLENADHVIAQVNENQKARLIRRLKGRGPICWNEPGNEKARKRLLSQWQDFGRKKKVYHSAFSTSLR